MLLTGMAAPASASDSDPCAAPTNPIVCENSKPGSPPSVWQVTGAGDPALQGFATDISVNVGETISFKVKASMAYTATVFRLGYYRGDGARQIASLTATPQAQPDCLTEATTGLVDCGNWAVSATWTVPTTAVSGVYILHLVRTDTNADSEIPFIVRDDSGHSGVVYQTSDPTWHAYNLYGGSDFYSGTTNNGYGRAQKISYNRPIITNGTASGQDYLYSNEYPMIRFLERNGYDVSYISGVDTDRYGSLLTNHKIFVSVGHDEYWSGQQRANVEAARDAGLNLAFFSGNEVYWKTRYETSIDGSNTAYRTLVCYKETWDNAKSDPASQWTGTWRDPRFSPPSDGGSPENGLTGTAYMSNNDDLPIQVPYLQSRLRFWRDTSVASLEPGQTATLAEHTVGYESDEDLDNGFRPAGLIDLSTTIGATPQYLQDFGSVVAPGTTTHHLTLYRASSGALVFGAGTIQYAWALDDQHTGQRTTVDSAMQQAVVNLFADMDVQPLTLMSGLTRATSSTDTIPPTVTITSPASGTSIANGSEMTISGTASDVGGIVAGVEVSTDGGTTWHPATGTTSWTYAFYATGSGSVSLKVRATDDSANTLAPTALPVTVNCPCSLFGTRVPANPTTSDNSNLELGVKFRATTDGVVTGIRFYKGSTANSGTHTGTLWSATGTKLATGTFTNETASGWQTMSFTNPVPIMAGTTYVASYTAPNGNYAGDRTFFTVRDWSAAPLVGLRSNGSTRNGVYAGGGSFPTQSFRDANYYVDVLFASSTDTPPSIVSTNPTSGAISSSRTFPITATFNVVVNSGTPVTTVTANGTPVSGTTTLDRTGHTLTFTPSSTLIAATTYSVTVSGAVGGNGIEMAHPHTWSFTTVGLCPCTVFPSSSTPAMVDSGDTAATELGMKVVPTEDGFITGVKFYKASTNTGTHTGSLWSDTGTRLATGTFTGESASGWQTLTFSAPVDVAAGTTYVVSYHAPNGHYSFTGSYFTSNVVSGSLTAPASGNGVYVYGDGFPSTTLNSPNYWVDALYVDASAKDTTPPTISAVTATPRATSATITWTTDKVSSSIVSYGTSASSLTQTAMGPGSVTSHSVTLTGLTPGTTYYYTVTSTDTWENTATSPASPASVTTATCPCTVFSSSATPLTVDSGDAAAVELGMKFVPDVGGYITGVKFYKASTNTGTHTGSLWSDTGTRLATGTFTGESASGWQTLTFSAPVDVAAGTTYVVSYYTPSGHYSYNGAYFASTAIGDAMTAPGSGNGVYAYGGGFPSGTYHSANYWVDVVFTNVRATTPPTITDLTTTGTDATSTSVTWTTDSQSTSEVTYGTSASSLTSTASSGEGTSHSVGINGLSPGTGYYFRVRSTDVWGNSSTYPDSGSAPATFTTANCPCSVFPSSSVPAVADSGDGAAIELGMRFVPVADGTVTGVRFYKASTNTGTHTGSLWSSAGTLLATGTFSGETASGWQTLMFSTPVSVAAGTTYVVSYSAPNGHYSYSGSYFTSNVQNGALSAPAAGNGLYRYGSGFPNQTYNSANYWVDVVYVSPTQ